MDTASFFEELDDDSFLPTTESTLANIFGNQKKSHNSTNESLKYIPPKPPEANQMKGVSDLNTSPYQTATATTTSECLMGKVVHAYELVNGVYNSRGKLGFAIMKILNPPHTKLIIFNATKTTVSSVVASEHLEVTLQSNNYITYYDEHLKNWSLLLANSDDVSEVLNELNKHQVKIVQVDQHSKSISIPSLQTNVETQSKNCDINVQSCDDTDLSKKTKLSLINRMAIMGQAILPPHPTCSNQSSDSSDENIEPKAKLQPARHKGIKPVSIVRRPDNGKGLTESSDNSTYDIEKINVSSIVSVASQSSIIQPTTLFTYMNGQIIPVTSNDNNLNIFTSEMRMNNSEARININRIADKVDQVLDRLKVIEDCKTKLPTAAEGPETFTMEIFQKLLREYEDKIRMKDTFIASLEGQLLKMQQINESCEILVTDIQDIDNSKVNDLNKINDKISSENVVLRAEIEKVKLSLESKTTEIEMLQEQIEILKSDNKNIHTNDDSLIRLGSENMLRKEVTGLKCELELEKENACDKLQIKREDSTQCNNLELESEIKKIMNNTYRALAVNFDPDQSYSGSSIRSVIATVIKQTTFDALNSRES